ncbi:WD40 repeat domain-containing protein [Aspergillus glaucus CBS 516.65]|uniref:Mitochondrial division protein 1 n=1 Tax=Aspergillus glaucus CBS 516.65 TaxID=1160497 RepID=A0A1L9VDB9_ASPGL|nr:hypothetical protein ASPGLDRAFT_84039 [Aspergillus glaucus CBS 516.65]OJJ81885.1 hypothetical protein ASPGLDRAFT_84039 [Aspergillus glaucus CBS 516.65]
MLVKNADGIFLWVALVCQYLENVPRDPLTKLRKFPPGLGPLYERMMKEILESLELEDINLCKQILEFMTVAHRPTTLKELAYFIETSEALSDNLDSLKTDIGLCGSFLTVKYNTVYFMHQSAKGFLVEKASSEIFPSGMEETTKQHEDLQDGSMVDKFLRKHYLHWLEALALLGGLSEGILAMSQLADLAQAWKSWSACLQTLEGHSNWVYSVTFSHDSKLLASALRDRIIKVWDASNAQCLQTLEGHGSSVNSVIFSHDSKLLASASRDRIVKVWDASNG